MLTVAPLVGTAWATGAADLVLVGLSAAGAGAAGMLWRLRKRLAHLPLEVSPKVLYGQIHGKPVYRFRVRLGRGRVARALRAEVSFESGSQRVRLRTVGLGDGAVIGPWTVAAVDDQGVVGSGGELVLRVAAREAERAWDRECRWPVSAVRPGRFDSGLRRQRGRLDWDPKNWDAVLDETA